MADEGPVVLDTMVFSAFGVRGRTELRAQYRPHVEGRRIVLSFQTVAEVRFGALNAGWGAARRQELEQRLLNATVAVPDDDLARAYAQMKHELRQLGHGLSQKDHDGDRWIAATAVHHGLPLASSDGIFVNVPGLELIRAGVQG